MQNTQSRFSKESFLVLLKGTLIFIPFNIIAALLLSFYFIYNNFGELRVFSWFAAIFFLNAAHFIFNQRIIAKKYYLTEFDITRFFFLIFTFLSGLTWGTAFFIFLPVINGTQQAIIVLVLGGMSAAGIAVLAIYLASSYAYAVPMVAPLIFYNIYSLKPDRIMTGIFYAIFLMMLYLVARMNSRVFQASLKLDIEKNLLIKELKIDNLKLERSFDEARALSITDSLTGLYNRRYFDLIGYNELRKAQRHHYAINLVLIDIDNFKYINDTFGHPVGDDFLINVAQLLKNAARRANDLVFRLGGDEFALILSHMGLTDVELFCEGLQHRFMNNHAYEHVTLSIGIANILSCQSLDFHKVIAVADRALYQAKKEGKNKIITTAVNE